ncbi:hypothetical protein VD0004_g6122 [Verticillium dahliae]|nr:hypothetical protein VD0004_g6122 [Verticillium dahliae]PNH72620.1 hypothetical protein VD0001_g4945 [Verticillium dahliae]
MAGHGAASGPSQLPELFAARLALNKLAVTYFAAALVSLMAIFIGFHFTRVLAHKSGLAPRLSILATPFLIASRILRRRLLAKAPFLPSVGHAGLALIYVALNIVLTFKPLMNHPALALLSNIASRTGWLALANICLAVFLGLKNTPLGYLTTWSYERLNVIHQIVGYTAMAMTAVHGIAYSVYFIQRGNMARLRVQEEIYGIVAGFTMLTLVIVGFTIRRWYYELFYLVHVSFFVVTMVFIGLHQPETHKHVLIATGVGAGMWALDRLLRILRVSLYSFNNQATIHPLPHGGTRIVLRKPPIGARSGEHCFLWVPSIRSIEMHPFTIAAADPLEFVVASYDGFTRDLHKYAIQNPGASLRASVEGSYGTFPDPTSYDKVVLIAGGSGASFTVGMALNMIKHANAGSRQSVVFIWMVKDNAHLEWFSDHLATIRQSLNSSISLYVTRSSRHETGAVNDNALASATTVYRNRAATFSSSDSSPDTPVDDEKRLAEDRPGRILTRHISDPEKSEHDLELESPTSPGDTSAAGVPRSHQQSTSKLHIHGIPITYARPDVSALINHAIAQTPSSQRLLVMGCGPEGLMTQVRNTTAESVRRKGPAVELHCEQFGW